MTRTRHPASTMKTALTARTKVTCALARLGVLRPPSPPHAPSPTALGSSILHGKGATGQALSRSYPRGSGGAAGAVRGESKAQAPPNSEWGLEPEDTEAFTRLTRAKYLDNGGMLRR